MPRDQRSVEQALVTKGFQKSGGDHRYFHYYAKTGQKSRVFTKTSHGNRELSDSLLSMMAKQCRLTKGDFLQLVDCPMDRNAYEVKLALQGLITTTE